MDKIPFWLKTIIPFEKQIKYVRKYLKMSQRQLALKVGTSQSGIANIENGNNSPTLSTLKNISLALNCSLRIVLIPNEDLDLYLTRKIDQKVDKVIKDSVLNSTLEQQVPSDEVVAKLKQKLKEEFKKSIRNIWDD